MRRTFCFVVASAALVLASSCSEHALTPIGDSLVSEKIETSLPLGTNAVDILWLVDNSASMEAEQRELGARFDEFVAALADLQADFHMGVVTTDLNDPQRAGRFNVAPGNLISLGCSASAPELAYCADSAVDGAFLRRSSYGAADEVLDIERLKRDFRCVASAGSCGSGFEQGLEALGTALGPELLSGANQGFLRDDAFLLVIVLSDEDDCSNGGAFSLARDQDCYAAERRDQLTPVSVFFDQLVDLKTPSAEDRPDLDDEARRALGESKLLIAGIIGTDDRRDPLTYAEITCDNCWPQYSCINQLESGDVQAIDGERYRELIELAGRRGVEESICQGSFASALDRIGDILRENLDVNCLVAPPVTCETDDDCIDGVGCNNPGDVAVGDKFCDNFGLRVEVQRSEDLPWSELRGPGTAGEEPVSDAEFLVDYDASLVCPNGVAFSFAPGARPPSGSRYRAFYPAEADVRDAFSEDESAELGN